MISEPRRYSEYNRPSRPRRRGSIYVVTLTTTLIVTALGVVALSTMRIQRKQAAEAASLRQAQLHAESALQIARYRIRTDSSWRTKLNSNTWGADQPIGNGHYSFTGIDPIDGNLTNNDLDPVTITATGKEGGAISSLSAQYEFEQPGLSCLQSGIHAGGDLEFSNVTARSSDAAFSSNAVVKAQSNSLIYGNCAAVSQVNTGGNAQIFGTSTNGISPRVMPNPVSVLSYYQSLGTTILASSLPLWNREHLTNPGAESGAVTPWVASNATASVTTGEKKSGAYSFYIQNRLLVGDGTIRQDITSKVAQNVQYLVSAWVLDKNLLGLDSYRLHIKLETSNGNVSYTSAWFSPSYNVWGLISFSPTLTWTGTLTKAELFVQSSLNLLPFYLDDISVKEANAQSSTAVIHRTLISPQSNPFTGVLNSQGIYVLNCGGTSINIRDTRILGTLVILNPGSNSKIEGSVCWDPFVALSTNPNVPNLPALITDGKLLVALNSTALSESGNNTNFNPVGSPYSGATDADKLDTYPSQISGVLYSSNDFDIGKFTTINGSVVGAALLTVTGTSPPASNVTINYQPLYYYVNPPIGFRAAPVFKLKSGSVEQVVQ